MKVRTLWIFVFVLFLPLKSLAGLWEVSAFYGWDRRNYTDGFTRTIRYGGAVGYRFTNLSSIELGVQKSTQKVFIQDFQDTQFDDLVMSLNWVQSFLGREAPVQPYTKIGVAQLNRDQSGTYLGQPLLTSRRDVISILLGVGLRVNFSRRLGLRTEYITYLEKGSIRSINDNAAINLGLTLFL